MNLKENCCCGAELNIDTSYTTENNTFVAYRYKEFLDAHKDCRKNQEETAGKSQVEKLGYNLGEVVSLLEKILQKLEEVRCGLIDIENGVEKL